MEISDSSDIEIIYTSLVEKKHLLEGYRLAGCPSLFQERIDKFLDVRICIVDDYFHAVGLRCRDGSKQILDIRRDNMSGVIHGEIEVPDSIREQAISLVRSYGLRFAAIDMVIDDRDDWVFLEINPNGQWAWLDLVGATRIVDSFIRVFRGGNTKGGG